VYKLYNTDWSIKNDTLTTTHEPFRALKTNGNIKFLQPYPVNAVDALLDIGKAVISAAFVARD
jgi:hypothetical protein